MTQIKKIASKHLLIAALLILLILFPVSTSSSTSSKELSSPNHHRYSKFFIDSSFSSLHPIVESYPPHSSPSPSPSPPESPLAPALFVIGDSTVDCGTNNYLGTLARADRPPYGRDFDTHQPTGRFSNGRIIVDYLAIRLGLPFVPPYLGQSGKIEDMIHGVSYASAAAGIIYSSGSDLGQHISLTQQIQQVTDTFQELELNLGEDAASDLISRSIFYISIGSNDFIHYYLRNESNVQSLYFPWEFNQLLATTVMQEIQNLYNVNVRKMVVMGLAPVGCAPHYLWQYGSRHGECIDPINDVMVDFNYAMRSMVRELNRNLTDAMITFCDAFEGSMDIMQNGHFYGFETTSDACCGLGKYGGLIMCLLPEMACSDANKHVWWDEFHPTEAVNKILADNIWDGAHINMCHPMNLKTMINLGR